MNVFEVISPLGMLTAVLAAAAIWSLLCRITVMWPGRTRLPVVIQHFVLALGMFAGFMWSVNWEIFREFGAHGWVIDLLERREIGPLAMAASVLIFLLMSAHRWRWNAPEGTNRSTS